MCAEVMGSWGHEVMCVLLRLQKAFTALCHSTHLYGRRLVLEWADGEDAVETLRKKTAEHFHGTAAE